jgi:phenylacetate-coenzyme A ligase PaaK-like adenylate-forming protein
MTKLPAADRVSRLENPLDWTKEKSALMVEACRELAKFHFEHSPELSHLYRKHGFDPDSIREEKDLERIPSVNVTAMKWHLLKSQPEETAVLKLTSSGTSGQKTQIWFDQGSLDRVQSMMDVLWGQAGLVTDDPTNYVIFIYHPDEAKDLGIAFTAKNEMRFANPHEAFFTVRKNAEGAWEFRMEETIQAMERFSREGYPVRLLGIPSFLYDLVSEVRRRGKPIQLPPGSRVIIGGGWKAKEDKKVTKHQFQVEVSEALGIPLDNMFDLYGMAEHSAPYLSCKNHRHHVPVFNRILIRDPETMKAVEPGKLGLIELITPYNTMMPNLAILSTDLGYLHKDPCGCGWNSPTFEIVGRGGISKHKGCAITAADIVRRH